MNIALVVALLVMTMSCAVTPIRIGPIAHHWHGHYTIPVFHGLDRHVAFYVDHRLEPWEAWWDVCAIDATTGQHPGEPGVLRCPVCHVWIARRALIYDDRLTLVEPRQADLLAQRQ